VTDAGLQVSGHCCLLHRCSNESVGRRPAASTAERLLKPLGEHVALLCPVRQRPEATEPAPSAGDLAARDQVSVTLRAGWGRPCCGAPWASHDPRTRRGYALPRPRRGEFGARDAAIVSRHGLPFVASIVVVVAQPRPGRAARRSRACPMRRRSPPEWCAGARRTPGTGRPAGSRRSTGRPTSRAPGG
jgi:hypothetical protein